MADREDFATAVGTLVRDRTVAQDLGDTSLDTVLSTQVRRALVSSETQNPSLPDATRMIITTDGDGIANAVQRATAVQGDKAWWRACWDGAWTAWYDDLSTADLAGLVTATQLSNALTPRNLGATDLDTLTTTQVRTATVSSETNAPNMPTSSRSVIRVTGNGSQAIQQVNTLQGRNSWWRVLYSGTWSAWYQDPGGINVLATATDYDTLTTTATTLVLAGDPLGNSTNAPTQDRHILAVTGHEYGAGIFYVTQQATSLQTGRIYTRAQNAGAWSPWGTVAFTTDTAPVTGGADAGLTNRLLVEDWSRRRGGRKRIDTGAIALRFDHGLANFDTLIRPLLEARGLPYSLALCSGQWGNAENAGVTAAMVDGWVQGGLCEVWNHSATHGGATDIPGSEVEIVQGLADLRAQLPSAQIDGFAIPGTAGRGFGPGFVTGATVQEFYDSEGGRMILSHHAVSTGYIPGSGWRTLDGMVRQGEGHYTLDKASLATAQAQIATAETDKKGMCFMIHPSLVDTADHITTATVEQILDHIVTERDAGRLTVLGPYDLMLADAT